jgi:signal transduction histidine kinase
VSVHSFETLLELATGAHDLRNRLGIACCELRLLRCLGVKEPSLAKPLEAVQQALAHTNALLEDLLQQACRVPGVCVSERSTAVDVVALAQRLAVGRDRVSVVARVPHLWGDWDQARLAHALRNLLTNALQYSPSASSVVVTVDRCADEALLTIQDRGIGIPPADLPHVVEPFFRAGNAEFVSPGLGLGLATARLIVEQYAGTLQIESREGAGTTAVIRLPLRSEERRPEPL